MFRRPAISAPTFSILLVCGMSLAAGCLTIAGPRVRGILWNTGLLSASSAAIALPVGVLAAVLLVKTDLPGRRAMLAAFGVLLFVPLYLHAAGWQAGFGVAGWFTTQPEEGLTRPLIDGWPGAIWIHAMAAIPPVVWIVAAGLWRTPRSPEEEASLVATPARVLWSITLPAARPAIFVALLWVIVSVAAEMTVTDFFQIRTFAEEVYTQAAAGGFQSGNPAADYLAWNPVVQASGLVGGLGLLTVLAGAMLLVIRPWLTGASYSDGRSGLRWRLGPWRLLGTATAGMVLILVAALPLACLIHQAGLDSQPSSAGWRRAWSLAKFQHEITQAAGLHARELWQTVRLGLAVATAATLLGILAGWRLRTHPRPPWLLMAILALALAVPGPVLGIAVIHLLNHPANSWFSPLTEAYYRSLLAPWLVQTVRFTPVTAIVMAAGFASVPSSLLDAAKADGAGRLWRLVGIALPMTVPMAAAAWLVALALSAGELAATVLVMPPGPPTLTIRLFSLLHYGVEDRVAAISLVLLAAISCLAAIAVWLAGRGRPPARKVV